MMPITVDVTIILLNWNSRPVVFDAAASALAQTGVTSELIIVDNGSRDGSLQDLKERFPEARYLEIGFNSGFTGGMNAGTSAAHGEFVLWQNADLVLADDYCSGAVEEMRKDRGLGAVGGLVRRLVDGRRTDMFDASGYTLSRLHRTVVVTDRLVAQDVVGVSGSCPVIRRAALESLRGAVGYILDPWYFTYGEDIDVMLRLNLGGWRVRYRPDLHAWHVRSGSTVAASRFYEKPDATQVHHFKNRIATIIKTYPLSLLAARLFFLVAAEVALPTYLLFRGRPRSLQNWLHAWREVWGERNRLLRDRASIQRVATAERIQQLRALLQSSRRPVQAQPDA